MLSNLGLLIILKHFQIYENRKAPKNIGKCCVKLKHVPKKKNSGLQRGAGMSRVFVRRTSLTTPKAMA
jgi:hypothetical protein